MLRDAAQARLLSMHEGVRAEYFVEFDQALDSRLPHPGGFAAPAIETVQLTNT
jgi:hypothetical protein